MKLIILYLFSGLVGVLVACGSRYQAAASVNDTADVKINIDKSTDSMAYLSTKKIDIQPNSVVKIISVNRESDATITGDSVALACQKWSVSAEAIEIIIKNGEPINMHDFSYLYYVLPCQVKGVIELDAALYNYSVNAGAFFTISNKDTTCYYGCDATICKKYFIIEGGDPRRDLE